MATANVLSLSASVRRGFTRTATDRWGPFVGVPERVARCQGMTARGRGRSSIGRSIGPSTLRELMCSCAQVGVLRSTFPCSSILHSDPAGRSTSVSLTDGHVPIGSPARSSLQIFRHHRSSTEDFWGKLTEGSCRGATSWPNRGSAVQVGTGSVPTGNGAAPPSVPAPDRGSGPIPAAPGPCPGLSRPACPGERPPAPAPVTPPPWSRLPPTGGHQRHPGLLDGPRPSP